VIWFTADTHLEHGAVIRHSRRPWNNPEDMNEALISNINEVVGRRDTLYHLGDFAWKGTRIKYWRDRIVCKDVRLVCGNHDPTTKNGTPKEWLKEIFQGVTSLSWVRIESRIPGNPKQLIVLCHYGFETWHKMHFGSWHLHGHSHGSLGVKVGRMDVGVDAQGYYPVSEEQLRDWMPEL
jgi:calcineurin-like phosphoesterase family protein